MPAFSRSEPVKPVPVFGLGLQGRMIFAQSRKHHRPPVREFRDQGQSSAHSFDGFAEGRKQEIAALFESRNAILIDSKSLGDADLRKLAGFPKLTQGHLFGH